MTVDRRKLFALGGLGVIGAGTGAYGAEANLHGGVTVTLQRSYDGWGVAVPNLDEGWRPGDIPQVKLMPIADFLAALEELRK